MLIDTVCLHSVRDGGERNHKTGFGPSGQAESRVRKFGICAKLRVQVSVLRGQKRLWDFLKQVSGSCELFWGLLGISPGPQ